MKKVIVLMAIFAATFALAAEAEAPAETNTTTEAPAK
jgi:hypothetical protein